MTGVVTELHLRGAYLSGSLSANSNLFIFNHLKYLNLSYNYFDSFSFLPELGKLRMLEVLDLSDMDLVDEITSSINSLNCNGIGTFRKRVYCQFFSLCSIYQGSLF